MIVKLAQQGTEKGWVEGWSDRLWTDWTEEVVRGKFTVKSLIEPAPKKMLPKKEQSKLRSVLFWVTFFGVRVLLATLRMHTGPESIKNSIN